MRVGLDGRALQGRRTGVGRYVFEICRELDTLIPEAEFFVYAPEPVELTRHLRPVAVPGRTAPLGARPQANCLAQAPGRPLMPGGSARRLLGLGYPASAPSYRRAAAHDRVRPHLPNRAGDNGDDCT